MDFDLLPTSRGLRAGNRSGAVFVRKPWQTLARAGTVLGAFVAALLLVLDMGSSRSAVAQSDPYSGLSAEVNAVAEAVRSGSLQRILAALPPDGSSVVRTAFPGDGGAVTQETARQEITALVVSDAGRSDAFGNGAYTLLAVWRPSINPGGTLLIGSGIGLDGVRVSTGFSVSTTDGRTGISAYGWVFDLSATLAQWGGQGDLRLISATTPFPPATGSGPAIEREPTAGRESISVGLLLAGVTTVAALAFRTARRRAR